MISQINNKKVSKLNVPQPMVEQFIVMIKTKCHTIACPNILIYNRNIINTQFNIQLLYNTTGSKKLKKIPQTKEKLDLINKINQ